MIEFIRKSVTWAFAAATGIFTFVPEPFFGNFEWISQDFLEHYKVFADLKSNDVNVIISRLVFLMGMWILTSLISWRFTITLYQKHRNPHCG